MMKIVVAAAAAWALLSAPAIAAPEGEAKQSRKSQYEDVGKPICAGQWRAWYADWLGKPGNPNGHEMAERYADLWDADVEASRQWFWDHCW